MYQRMSFQKVARFLLGTKLAITFPFYVIGIVDPDMVFATHFHLYMEAFHHFHARIFYWLACYRCLVQLYFMCNMYRSKVFLEFIRLEVLFEVGLLGLYLHEHMKNGVVMFKSYFFALQCFASLCTMLTYRATQMQIDVERV